MSSKRLEMSIVKRFLELRLNSKLSQRQVAKSLSCSRRTIQRYEQLMREKGLTDPVMGGNGKRLILLRYQKMTKTLKWCYEHYNRTYKIRNRLALFLFKCH